MKNMKFSSNISYLLNLLPLNPVPLTVLQTTTNYYSGTVELMVRTIIKIL